MSCGLSTPRGGDNCAARTVTPRPDQANAILSDASACRVRGWASQPQVKALLRDQRQSYESRVSSSVSTCAMRRFQSAESHVPSA